MHLCLYLTLNRRHTKVFTQARALLTLIIAIQVHPINTIWNLNHSLIHQTTDGLCMTKDDVAAEWTHF